MDQPARAFGRPLLSGGDRDQTRRVWNDTNSKAVIEAFTISGMAHGVPIAASTGGETCGAAGAFFLDVAISSTHHIARFWHLHESVVEMPRAPAPLLASRRARRCHRWSCRRRLAHYRRSFPRWRWRTTGVLLTRPECRDRSGLQGRRSSRSGHSGRPAGAKPAVAPGPIIAAALKAAGLMRT
jgi:hypothetical protein